MCELTPSVVVVCLRPDSAGRCCISLADLAADRQQSSIYYVHKVDVQGTRHLALPADVRDSCFRGGAGAERANLLWLRCQATDSSEQSQRDSCESLTAVAEREDQITV